MEAVLRAIEYYLPERALTNDQLSAEFPQWPVAKIEAKTGVVQRRIAGPDECASDLAAKAAEKLFRGGLRREDVDFLLFCTQSPDYFLPTTACLLQERLGLPTTAGALDFNLGCSGYVYGLSLALGLVASGQARNVLFLTGETYSKFLDRADRSVRTIFGDGGTATWIGSQPACSASAPAMGPVIFGTDGKGGNNLIVREGGLRHPNKVSDAGTCLRMNGGEVFIFTMETVPGAVQQLLERANMTLDDVDMFIFHQANLFMLEHLRRRVGIPQEKFVVELRDCGNTVSNTIPLAVKRAVDTGRIRPGHRVMLVGFGVGYSWSAMMLRWTESAALAQAA